MLYNRSFPDFPHRISRPGPTTERWLIGGHPRNGDATVNPQGPSRLAGDNHFEAPLAFSSAMEGCMFCPGSGTKQAQSCVRWEGKMNKRKLGSFALSAMLFALWLPAAAQQPA